MSFLVKYVGLPVAERLKGWPVRRYLRELETSQWWVPEQIAELQNEKLRRLIRHAYGTVPYYRELLDKNSLKPDDFESVFDMPKLPVLTKDAIRSHPIEHMLSSDFDQTKLVRLSSSGSTGEPFRYYLTEDEKARKWAGLFRFWSWGGFRLGDKYAVLAARPYKAFNSGILGNIESKFSGVLNLSAFDMYNDVAPEYARKLAAFKPLMLRGYASSLHYLAQVVRDQRIDLKLNAVCSTGETLLDFQRELIESVFRCKVYDAYGGEGMETAGQCDYGLYHINAESVLVEIVDDDGKHCPPGIPGRVVLTDLNHYSMPFIRYDIQDMAIQSDKQCPCCRGLPALERIYGRLTDVGVTPSGKGILVHHFTALFMKYVEAATAFQVVQEKPDFFILNIVPGPKLEEMKPTILAEMQKIVGEESRVEVRILSEIPVTAGGKRRLFISKCGLKGAGSVQLI